MQYTPTFSETRWVILIYHILGHTWRIYDVVPKSRKVKIIIIVIIIDRLNRVEQDPHVRV